VPQTWTAENGPKTIFDNAVRWLGQEKVLPPGVLTLARLVSRMRDETTQAHHLASAIASERWLGKLELPLAGTSRRQPWRVIPTK
jgi:hypothetical protein